MDFLILILVKSEFKVKLFMFAYIHVKELNNHVWRLDLKIIASKGRINFRGKINYDYEHSKFNFKSSKSLFVSKK
jgi:major membrane immunogen (membrane-anchored lipoprotein)